MKSNPTPHFPMVSPPDDSGERLTATFVRIGGRLRRLAFRLLGDEDEADDTLHEAFCRLWTKRERIAVAENEEAVLTTTVRNLSIDTLRRKKAHPTTSLDAQTDDRFENQISAAHYEAVETDEREACFRQVERLIETHLTPLQQTLLKRRDIEDESYADIARDLGMREAAVRMQLSRARRTIRELYRQQKN
ncbi:RNA polymerase sigma factor [Alloprevotella sp. OH1205_COT-284]|uniref:RNA polymerase sigma factor n=1 Tax=Alloprevotella sp. OH1205_COT-284 TaxID=2491043 RepID=UPI001F247A71|nr:sigma-70 family RNA polymerase sigma factor [Alloprevotella sp. OH1205_COT-284]